MQLFLKSTKLFFTILSTMFILLSCETNQVTSINMDSATKELVLGQIDSLSAEVKYTGDIVPSVEWSSSNTAVVKVNEGEIEAVAKGTAVISAQAGDKTTSCTVTVSNEINPTFTQGELWYWGDFWGVGCSNFTVCIADDNINMEDLSGDGEFMYIELNTGISFTDSIPDGIYEVNDTLGTGFIVPAYVANNGSPWGTWYFGKTYNDVVGGQAVLTVNNNTYTINYDLVDYYGNTIAGSYVGTLTYYDLTSYVSAPAYKAVKFKNKLINHSQKTFLSPRNR
jgi:hypothetical protein